MLFPSSVSHTCSSMPFTSFRLLLFHASSFSFFSVPLFRDAPFHFLCLYSRLPYSISRALTIYDLKKQKKKTKTEKKRIKGVWGEFCVSHSKIWSEIDLNKLNGEESKCVFLFIIITIVLLFVVFFLLLFTRAASYNAWLLLFTTHINE